MKFINLLVFLLVFSFSINFVSSNGLSIEIDGILQINKTFEEDYNIDIIISNSEPFTFYNITFENNNIIEINKINSLGSGQNITVEATVKTNSNYNGQIKLRGDYYSDVGQSNNTEYITIDYSNGFNKCNLNLIQGDTIIWENKVLGEIKLRNINTNEDFAIILQGENYTQTFEVPMEFSYYAMRIGFPFTPACVINIQDSSGYVHSSNYDTMIDLNIKIIYDPTSIFINFLTTSYVLNYNGQVSDIFTIRNDGNNVAKDININADWFSFSDNNFDLNPGESKNIGYDINPVVFQTNQTNQTYLNDISITGNFEERKLNISIFINYKNLDNFISGGQYNEEFMENFIILYCQNNQQVCDEIFPPEFIYGNNSQQNVSLIFNVDTFKALIQAEANRESSKTAYEKTDLEFKANISSQLSNNNDIDENQTAAIQELVDQKNNFQGFVIFLIILFLGLIAIVIISLLVFHQYKKNKLNEKAGFTQFEKY